MTDSTLTGGERATQFQTFDESTPVRIRTLHNGSFFNYTSDPVRTIWGFYRGDKKTYHAPINSNKIGEVVDLNQTRSYTAMQLNLNPLEAAFL